MAARAVTRASGEGPRRSFYGGGIHTWKVRAEESGGTLFLFEDELTRGKTTPWHCHPENDEMTYILEGEILSNVDGEERRLTAGAVSFVPRGTPHAFVVLSDRARLLDLHTPGTSDAFYWNASEDLVDGVEAPVDFARIGAVAAATGATTVLGPPPFDRP